MRLDSTSESGLGEREIRRPCHREMSARRRHHVRHHRPYRLRRHHQHCQNLEA